jgi:hypothetical protein
MTTLNDLRAYVWNQTEQTSGELQASTIDLYLLEAFNRTISMETEWPFYRTDWTMTQTAGDTYFPLDSDVDQVLSVKDTTNDNYRLQEIDYEEGEDQYFRQTSTGYPQEYSIWGGNAYLWPITTFDTNREYAVRGYRKPTDWTALPGNEVDADSRLHLPLAHYAIALAYAKQEDEVLEAQYMDRWFRDVEAARKAIMAPQHNSPLTMGPQRITRIGHGRYRPSFTITTT